MVDDYGKELYLSRRIGSDGGVGNGSAAVDFETCADRTRREGELVSIEPLFVAVRELGAQARISFAQPRVLFSSGESFDLSTKAMLPTALQRLLTGRQLGSLTSLSAASSLIDTLHVRRFARMPVFQERRSAAASTPPIFYVSTRPNICGKGGLACVWPHAAEHQQTVWRRNRANAVSGNGYRRSHENAT